MRHSIYRVHVWARPATTMPVTLGNHAFGIRHTWHQLPNHSLIRAQPQLQTYQSFLASMLWRQAVLEPWPTTLIPGQHLHAPSTISKRAAPMRRGKCVRARLNCGVFGVTFGGDAIDVVVWSSSSSLSLCVPTGTVNKFTSKE